MLRPLLHALLPVLSLCALGACSEPHPSSSQEEASDEPSPTAQPAAASERYDDMLSAYLRPADTQCGNGDDDVEHERERAEQQLAALGVAAIPAIRTRLTREEGARRSQLRSLLLGLGPDGRREVFDLIRRGDSSSVVPYLRTDPELMEQPVEGLLEEGDVDDDDPLPAWAAMALGQICTLDTLPAQDRQMAVARLRREEGRARATTQERARAMAALCPVPGGANVCAHAARRLQSDERSMREAAVTVLGRCDPTRLETRLDAMLETPRLRQGALWLIARHRLTDRRSQAEALLDEPDAAIQVLALQALVLMDAAPPDAFERLEGLIDERAPIAELAAQLLGEIGTLEDSVRVHRMSQERFPEGPVHHALSYAVQRISVRNRPPDEMQLLAPGTVGQVPFSLAPEMRTL